MPGNDDTALPEHPANLTQRHPEMLTAVYEFPLIANGLGKICSPRMGRIFFKAETRPLPCPTNIALVEVA